MNLDEAIQQFAAYARGEGAFDELDLKEVIETMTDEAYKRGYIARGVAELTK